MSDIVCDFPDKWPLLVDTRTDFLIDRWYLRYKRGIFQHNGKVLSRNKTSCVSTGMDAMPARYRAGHGRIQCIPEWPGGFPARQRGEIQWEIRVRLDLDTGLVAEARFVASPNCDARPQGSAIDAAVVHAISLPPNRFGGHDIEAFFCNCLDISKHAYFLEIKDLKVSAHFLIRRDGDLVQFVPTHMRAWHAGESELRGRSDVNNFSIGIELEGTDDQSYDEAQYDTLIQLTRLLTAAYPGIIAANLVGHCDIAPQRKTDPGPHFDWLRYRSQTCNRW